MELADPWNSYYIGQVMPWFAEGELLLHCLQNTYS
jgi:hypothetical protein